MSANQNAKQDGKGAPAPRLRDVLEQTRCYVRLVVRDQRGKNTSDATLMSAPSGVSLIDQLEHSRVLAGKALLECCPILTLDEHGECAVLVATIWPFGDRGKER